MPEYNYVARGLRGKTEKGTATAASHGELLEQVSARGLFLISYEEARMGDQGQRMGAKELSELCRELGTMLEAGVTLLRAYDIMLRRDMPRRRRQALEQIYKSLLQGVAMSDAMEQQGRVFPPLLTNMFRAGEANGTVALTALRMADHYEKEQRLNNKVKSATTYPVILLVITVLVVIVIFTFVLPQFLELYEGKELPAITQAVISVSELFTKNGHILLLAAAGLLLVIYVLRQLTAVRTWWDRLKLRLPLVGRLLRIIATARFARTLSSLYASGLSILTALDISKGTLGNAYLARQFDGAIQEVRRGLPLSQALDKVDGLDKKLAATIAVGEESGRLEAMLLSVADSFEYESSEAAGRLVTLMEPLCIVIMAAIIGTIMVAVMLPIMGMYDSIESAGNPTLAFWLGGLRI